MFGDGKIITFKALFAFMTYNFSIFLHRPEIYAFNIFLLPNINRKLKLNKLGRLLCFDIPRKNKLVSCKPSGVDPVSSLAQQIQKKVFRRHDESAKLKKNCCHVVARRSAMMCLNPSESVFSVVT